jgi:adhesin HecA-like repeat protein
MAKTLEELAAETKGAVDAKVLELKTAQDEAINKMATKESMTELEAKNEALEASMRLMSEKLTEMSKKTNTELHKMDIKGLLEKNMGDIQKIFQMKKGEISLDIKAAAIMTMDGAVDETTHSIPNDLIESFSMREFVGKRYGTQYIQEVADVTTVAEMEQYTTWLEEGNEQGAFAIVAEGAVKPLVSTSLVRNVAEAQKVAGKYVVTEEFEKFRKAAYTIIRRLIMDKMVRDYSAIVTANLNAAAAAYVGTSLDGTINDPNDYDAIGAVAAQIQSLNFTPDILILNPQDAWRIRLEKDLQGRYLFPVITENGQTTMLGIRIFISTYQTVGYFTLGESKLFKIEEETMTIRAGYGIDVTTGTVSATTVVTAVSSDLDNNRMRVIVEMWFKSYLPTPYIGSFVRTQFSTVKAALAAA